MVASRHAAVPRGHYRTHVADVATALHGEYEIRVQPFQEPGKPWRAINLASVVLGSTAIVKQTDDRLILSANDAHVFPSGTDAIGIAQHVIQYRATPGASGTFAYWTATFTAVESGDIGVEIAYSTLDADANLVIEVHNLNQETVLSRVDYNCGASGGPTTFRTLTSYWPAPTVRVPTPGSYQIRVRTDNPVTAKAINIRSVPRFSSLWLSPFFFFFFCAFTRSVTYC